MPAAEFFDGFWTTSLEPDELLTAVRFPVWAGRCGFGVAEFARRHGDFAIAGAVAGVQLDPDRRVDAMRASPCSASATTPVRARGRSGADRCTSRSTSTADEVGRAGAEPMSSEPTGDMHAPPDYRTRVGRGDGRPGMERRQLEEAGT